MAFVAFVAFVVFCVVCTNVKLQVELVVCQSGSRIPKVDRYISDRDRLDSMLDT